MTTDVSKAARWRHDLKNQLGIVLGFSELLLNDLDPASSHHADVEEIHTAAKRALDLLAVEPIDSCGDSAWPPHDLRAT